MTQDVSFFEEHGIDPDKPCVVCGMTIRKLLKEGNFSMSFDTGEYMCSEHIEGREELVREIVQNGQATH